MFILKVMVIISFFILILMDEVETTNHTAHHSSYLLRHLMMKSQVECKISSADTFPR